MQHVNLTRNSSYELIRLLAQFFIVFYHLFFFFIFPITNNPLHKAVWLPLHIGVILFVLISGFFGIRSSIKGFVKLLGMMAVLYIPLAIANMLIMGGGKRDVLSFVFLISATPFWFMRTYIFLYLLAPMLNLYLQNADAIKRIYMIIVLAFISHWVGTIGLDPSLMDGKNVITFMFLYVIGDTLRVYNNKLASIPNYLYGLGFILLNGLLVLFYGTYSDRLINITYNKIFFSYCSFGLLVSSILFFLWIGNMHIKSRIINYLAKASLTIYMIHGSSIIFFQFLSGIVGKILASNPGNGLLFIEIFILTLFIVIGCIIIDIILRPIWRIFEKIGEHITLFYNKKINLFLSSTESR